MFMVAIPLEREPVSSLWHPSRTIPLTSDSFFMFIIFGVEALFLFIYLILDVVVERVFALTF